MKRAIPQVLFTALMVLLMASAAMANTHAPVGTITNTASVNYKDANNVAQTPVTANVVVTITQIYGVTVTPATDAKGGSDTTKVIYTVTVTNNGNGPDSFDLSSATTGVWTPSSVTFAPNSDGTGTALTATASLAQNATATVYMVVTVPAGAFTGDQAVTTFTATSHNDGGTPKANASDVCTTTAAGADNIGNSTKTSSTLTPVDGVPFTYTIAVNNAGTQNAATVVVTDVIGSNLAYIPGTITMNGTPVSDGTAWNAGTKTITINIGTLNHGVTDTITYQAQVNSGVADGTSITNTAVITYDAGTTFSPAVTVTAKGVPSLTLTKTVEVNHAGGFSSSANAKPGDTLTYLITATDATGAAIGTATNVVISDSIPADTTFVPGSIHLDGSGSASPDSLNSGGTISTPAVSIAPGATRTLQFDVTVN